MKCIVPNNQDADTRCVRCSGWLTSYLQAGCRRVQWLPCAGITSYQGSPGGRAVNTQSQYSPVYVRLQGCGVNTAVEIVQGFSIKRSSVNTAIIVCWDEYRNQVNAVDWELQKCEYLKTVVEWISHKCEHYSMEHKQAYHSVRHHYSTKMMRTSLAVGVVWGVASICLAICIGLVFMQVSQNYYIWYIFLYQDLSISLIFSYC